MLLQQPFLFYMFFFNLCATAPTISHSPLIFGDCHVGIETSAIGKLRLGKLDNGVILSVFIQMTMRRIRIAPLLLHMDKYRIVVQILCF